MKITSKFIHIFLTLVISWVIVFFPFFVGEEIIWDGYTDCNNLTTVGKVVTFIWLWVFYWFVAYGIFNFLKQYTDYD